MAVEEALQEAEPTIQEALPEAQKVGPEVESAVTQGTTDLAEKISNPLENIKYTPKVLKDMETDLYHGFPSVIDSFGSDATKTIIKGGDNILRTKYAIGGAINKVAGAFEYIFEPDGVTCNHRCFSPN